MGLSFTFAADSIPAPPENKHWADSKGLVQELGVLSEPCMFQASTLGTAGEE